MDKISVRAPHGEDLGLALKDMATLHTAPPLVLSLAGVFLATGSLVTAIVGVGATSFVHALWYRLLETKRPGS